MLGVQSSKQIVTGILYCNTLKNLAGCLGISSEEEWARLAVHDLISLRMQVRSTSRLALYPVFATEA